MRQSRFAIEQPLLLSATASIDKINHWIEQYPDHSWAVATGTQSNVFAVEASQELGVPILRARSEDDLALNDTLQIRSNNHVSLFFRWPESGLPACRRELITTGVYVRQTGGYVALPSANEGTRHRYAFRDPEASICNAPLWLLNLITSMLGKHKSANLISLANGDEAAVQLGLAFHVRGGRWICKFHSIESGGAIVKTLLFHSGSTILRLAERGGVQMTESNRTRLHRSIQSGKGFLVLTLTRQQYIKLLAA